MRNPVHGGERGLSLLELAVVFGVMALATVLLLRFVDMSITRDRDLEAGRLVESLRDAAIGFALAGSRLPGPDEITVPEDPWGMALAYVPAGELAAASMDVCRQGVRETSMRVLLPNGEVTRAAFLVVSFGPDRAAPPSWDLMDTDGDGVRDLRELGDDRYEVVGLAELKARVCR